MSGPMLIEIRGALAQLSSRQDELPNQVTNSVIGQVTVLVDNKIARASINDLLQRLQHLGVVT
eukprot:4624635-Alexandrium_andersonii.AAC.1